MVEHTPNWTLVDVYVDDGISGTDNVNRPGFQRMMADCRAGKIDMIVTRSISRWGRNAEQTLSTLQSLYDLGIDVYFTLEKIHSGKSMGNLLLDLMSTFAEFESKSIKLNTKMGYKSRMMRGEFFYNRPPYGYDSNESGQLVVNEAEAAVVWRIYQMCLDGLGTYRIANALAAEGIPTKRGATWQPGTVKAILVNVTYTGDVILQKTIRVGNSPRKKNDGSEDSYYVSDHHPPIISHEVYEAAQEALKGRALGRKKGDGKSGNRYAFSSRLICGHCGHHLHRFSSAYEIKWICTGHNSRACPQMPVPDLEVKAAFKSILADIDRLLDIHSSMTAEDDPTAKLQANLSQQEAVKTLQPVLGAAEFTRRLNTLQQEEETLRQQVNGNATETLKRACRQVSPKARWAEVEPIFKDHVEGVTIWQGGRMEFRFKCGVRIVSERTY
jgi:site-specific DNA recombinase